MPVFIFLRFVLIISFSTSNINNRTITINGCDWSGDEAISRCEIPSAWSGINVIYCTAFCTNINGRSAKIYIDNELVGLILEKESLQGDEGDYPNSAVCWSIKPCRRQQATMEARGYQGGDPDV